MVLKFLSIASQVEKAALARLDGGGTPGEAELGRLVGDLWLAQAEIDLAARSEPLRGATYRYAFCLAAVARGEIAYVAWPATGSRGSRDIAVRRSRCGWCDHGVAA